MTVMSKFRVLWFLAFLLVAPQAFAQSCPQQQINAQTGTTYTVLNSDNCKKVSLSNSSAVAVTLPQAGANGNFGNSWTTTFVNLGSGAVTITPTTSTIDGLSSRVLQQFQGLQVTSNGANYVSSGISFVASSVSVPICPAGTGCPTTATPDIYPIGFAGLITASTVPVALCRVSPAATVTFLVKKWTAGNPASSSTLCTGSISTACALSACSISATSLSASDGLSIEGTEAGADATAVISVTVPFIKQGQ